MEYVVYNLVNDTRYSGRRQGKSLKKRHKGRRKKGQGKRQKAKGKRQKAEVKRQKAKETREKIKSEKTGDIKKSEPLMVMMTLIFFDLNTGKRRGAFSFNHGNHLITGISGSDN